MSPGALKTYRAREVTERIRDELRVSTLRRLEKSEEAETEADAVYDAFCRRPVFLTVAVATSRDFSVL